MINLKRISLPFLFAVIDSICAVVAYYLAALLKHEGYIPMHSSVEILITIPALVSILLFFSVVLGCYDGIYTYAGFSEMFRQITAVVATTCVLFVLKYLGFITVPNSVIFNAGILLIIMTGSARIFSRFMKWMSTTINSNGKQSKRIIIVGAGAQGAMVIKRWRANSQDNKYPVAVMDDDQKMQGKRFCGIRILGTTNDIHKIVKKTKADGFLITYPDTDIQRIKKLYHLCMTTGLPVKYYQAEVSMQDVLRNGPQSVNEVPVEDLINREKNQIDLSDVNKLIRNKTVLVTGGAGSIGSELCRQILSMDCSELIIFDINENAMFALNEELKQKHAAKRYVPVIGSVRDVARLDYVFEKYKPQIVFHAAAHKHVPMMECNPIEAINNNFVGTRNVIRTCKKNNVLKFVLISSDKAVNSTNIMGATKRLCELYLQSDANSKTIMAAVRFGNVLGSNGSVVPTFKRQIDEGGPVTVTHPEITRYFMTISEAVSLVLIAANMAKGREIFMLDMGKPIKIYDMACNLIRASGLEPGRDIDVVFTGLRPGEKLYEELNYDAEKMDATENAKIRRLQSAPINEIKLRSDIIQLEELIKKQDADESVKAVLFDVISSKPAPREVIQLAMTGGVVL